MDISTITQLVSSLSSLGIDTDAITSILKILEEVIALFK